MPEGKKDLKKDEKKTAEEPKTGHEHKEAHPEAPPEVAKKVNKPWEHFKQSAHFKKFQGHASPHMNRRTGGKGG